MGPTKRKTGGALLGDRIRMNAMFTDRVYMRSLATRDSRDELSKAIQEVIDVVRASGYDFIIVETTGIGQGDRKSTRLNSSHVATSYAVFCLKITQHRSILPRKSARAV